MLFLRVVPGFWIAVEERDHPDLRSVPLVITSSGARGALREVNLAAQKRDVRPGMTLAQARQHCADISVLEPDLPRYELAWEEVIAILSEYTPLVEPIEPGQAIADLTGCERLWGGIETATRRLVDQIGRQVGIEVWIGLASCRIVAELASTLANGILAVEPGREAGFLARLPITTLPGVDERLALTFQVLGLKTVGQLAALPGTAVAQRFGAPGKTLHAYARGIDPRPVRPPTPHAAVSVRRDCEDGTPEEAVAVIQRLAGECAAELQARSLAGRLIELTLIWDDPAPPQHALPVPAPAMPLPGGAAPAEHLQLPVPIHSHLPRPVTEKPDSSLPVPAADRLPVRPERPQNGRHKGKIVVRTPIATAPELAAQAGWLLKRNWTEPRPLRAIELAVGEFEQPAQLAFEEFNLLGETGLLGGQTLERRRIIARQGEMLARRYTRELFQHVADVDPKSLLTERRFRWRAGLGWEGGTRGKARRKR